MSAVADDSAAGCSSALPATPALLPIAETDQEARQAPRYRVLVHNDEVTPMDFVVDVLRGLFRVEFEAAVRIMLEAHQQGLALVAILPLEEAEFRVQQAHAKARTAKYPLTFTYEPEA